MSKKGGHVNNECGDFGDLFKTLVPMNSEEFKGYNEKKSVLLWDNIEKFFWLEEYYDNDKIIKPQSARTIRKNQDLKLYY